MHVRGCARCGAKRRRRGAVVVLVAVLIPVLLVIVGFAVDCANIQRAKTEMRAVADLSAKAAASSLSRSQDVNEARKAAREVAFANEIIGKPVVLDDADIVLGRSQRQSNGEWVFQAAATPYNSIQVTPKRTGTSVNGPLPLYFGGLIGRNSVETEMSAVATFLDVDICLVLDRSSSMKLSTSSTAGGLSTSDKRFCESPHGDSRWDALDDAVDVFLKELASSYANERVGLVTFASNYSSPCGEKNLEATLDHDLDSDLNRVEVAMEARSESVWNGNTNIDAGIRVGRATLTGASSREFAQKIMIVFTDGVYTGADPVPEARAAHRDNIAVHTITFSNGANQTDMKAVATAGGGAHYHAPDKSALKDIFKQMAAAITLLTQ